MGDVDAACGQPVSLLRGECPVVPDHVLDRICHQPSPSHVVQVVDAVRAFVNGDTTIAGAGRRRSSKARRDGKWRVSGRPSSNVTQSPTSHPSCVSGFCFSSPHALNSPAAITVMIPRRHISLCSPVHLAALRHLSLSLSLGVASVGNVERRRLQDAALKVTCPPRSAVLRTLLRDIGESNDGVRRSVARDPAVPDTWPERYPRDIRMGRDQFRCGLVCLRR